MSLTSVNVLFYRFKHFLNFFYPNGCVFRVIFLTNRIFKFGISIKVGFISCDSFFSINNIVGYRPKEISFYIVYILWNGFRHKRKKEILKNILRQGVVLNVKVNYLAHKIPMFVIYLRCASGIIFKILQIDNYLSLFNSLV